MIEGFEEGNEGDWHYKGWKVVMLKASILEKDKNLWFLQATKPLDGGWALLKPMGHTFQASPEDALRFMKKLIDEVSSQN